MVYGSRIQNINLAKLIQSPDLIRVAFMKHERADLINGAMKVIAGKNANSEFDLMLGEIAEKAMWKQGKKTHNLFHFFYA